MAITNINITQDNKTDGSDLLPVHSPLSFIAEVTHTGDFPDILMCQVRDETRTSPGISSFQCVFLDDVDATTRRFVFYADEVVRSIMLYQPSTTGYGKIDFEDFYHAQDITVEVGNITKELRLLFYDPNGSETAQEDQVFVHGAKQFGEAPNLKEVFDNSYDYYLCPTTGWCYVYFYNDDPTATISIEEGPSEEGFALDYDDIIFADYDDNEFTIQV